MLLGDHTHLISPLFAPLCLQPKASHRVTASSPRRGKVTVRTGHILTISLFFKAHIISEYRHVSYYSHH